MDLWDFHVECGIRNAGRQKKWLLEKHKLSNSLLYKNEPRLCHDRLGKKGLAISKSLKRRQSELNRCIEVLQTCPLPLGYDAMVKLNILERSGFVNRAD